MSTLKVGGIKHFDLPGDSDTIVLSGTDSAVTINGDLTANSLFGDGSQLTGVLALTGNDSVQGITTFSDSAVFLDRVGIGTNSPIVPFDVVAKNGAFAMSMRTRSNNDYAFFGMRSNDGTEDLADIAIQRTASDTGRMLFYTNNGGAATVKMSILPSGGVTFNGDTSTDNALDDYEEGTWTPSYLSGFSSVSYHATHLSGTYTKVGNQVSCWFYIYLDTSTGNGADIKIGGLPYTQRPNVSSGTVINVRAIGNAGYNTLISGKHLQFYGEPNTSYFYLYHDGSTASSVSGGAPSGTFLIGSLTYQAA